MPWLPQNLDINPDWDKITQGYGLKYFTFQSDVELETLAFSSWAEESGKG